MVLTKLLFHKIMSSKCGSHFETQMSKSDFCNVYFLSILLLVLELPFRVSNVGISGCQAKYCLNNVVD